MRAFLIVSFLITAHIANATYCTGFCHVVASSRRGGCARILSKSPSIASGPTKAVALDALAEKCENKAKAFRDLVGENIRGSSAQAVLIVDFWRSIAEARPVTRTEFAEGQPTDTMTGSGICGADKVDSRSAGFWKVRHVNGYISDESFCVGR